LWWNDYNEVFVETKIVRGTFEFNETVVTDGGSPGRSHDCLAAGTPVMTLHGPRAIEMIQVGDLVLSRHPETGELAYKPVLRTTTRPRGQTMLITAGKETFRFSRGHLFWVSDEGWVRARELQSGQELH